MMQCTIRKWEEASDRVGEGFDTYFHALSHDLRTPLNHISGFAELICLHEDLPHAQKEYAAAIVSACGELKNAVLAHLQLIERSFSGEAPPPSDH